MTDLQQIARHLDRIATCMESTTEIAKGIASVDPQQQVRDAIQAMKDSTPAFAKVFEQAEQLMLGQMPNKKGEISAPGSD